MTSRLERLFILLETGQSLFLRKAAAHQIGEIVKTHPNELEHLLNKLRPLIVSNSWETRIAASQTIEAIAKNLSPNEILLIAEQKTFEPNASKLDTFRLDLILLKGPKLLSSDTQKYEVKENESNLSEKVKLQRKLLNSKLGIDIEGAANLDTTHLFTDEDILMAAAAAAAQNNEADLMKTPMVKRKVSNSIDVFKCETPSPELDSKKVKLENEEVVNSGQVLETLVEHVPRPLELLTRWLMEKLFDSEWECRHGAATSLRELLRALSSTALKLQQKIDNYAKILLYLENCMVKLLSVVALDRFADYIGDEAVAPVRETCAQTVGIISSHLNFFTASSTHLANSSKLARLCQILNEFMEFSGESSWELRHSGIMALKYTIAASAAFLSNTKNLNGSRTSPDIANLKLIFDLTFNNMLTCLRDNDDDVRHVASSALEPVSHLLPSLIPSHGTELLIRILIDVLTNQLDDLATSCSNIMTLLSDLLVDRQNARLFVRLLDNHSIMPHLCKFLHHPSQSVRETVLSTIQKILLAIDDDSSRFESTESKENIILLFRLLYQQSILMSHEASFKNLAALIEQLWETLCERLSVNCLVNLCFPHITTWTLLMMHAPSQPIDPAYLLAASKHSADSHEFIGSNQIKFEDKQTKDLVIIKCRLLSIRLLARLFRRIGTINTDDPSSPINLIIAFLCNQINFKSGIQRFCFGLLICEWAGLVNLTTTTYFQSGQLLTNKILALLDEASIYFDEIALMFTRLQKDARVLLAQLGKFNIEALRSFAEFSVFTFEDVAGIGEASRKFVDESVPNKKVKVDLLTQISNLVELNGQASVEQEVLQVRSSAALAAASIALNCLSARMNPLVRPLIDSIRNESNADLQSVSSKHLAILLEHCAKRTPNPVPKIFKNILGYLTNDVVKTPVLANMALPASRGQTPDKEFYEVNRYYGIISAQHPENNDEAPVNLKLQIEKRGAEFTLKSICEHYLSRVEEVVPEVIQSPLSQLDTILDLNLHEYHLTFSHAQLADFSKTLTALIDSFELNLSKYQDLVNHLQLIEYLTSDCLSLDLLTLKFLPQLPKLVRFLKSPLSGVRHLTSRCITAISARQLSASMDLILEHLLDCLDHSEFNVFARQGAVELIHCLCEKLTTLIIPFTVILIVPVLKRMCDLDWYVRALASHSFATLIKLYPLGDQENTNNSSSSSSSSSSQQVLIKNEKILKIKFEQQDFLDQLLDNRKLRSYELPTDILLDVNLRPYQQSGINWLAFLKKFNLHGILCDDMGLGKTLQSICILAGDHYEKMKNYEVKMSSHQTQNLDDTFLPSIIICPTTLTNHWLHEIEKFVDKACLSPLIYAGSINERESLRKVFFKHQTSKKHNVFIVSYDIIRHDIAHICNQQWNYCILDEGHLIKSAKTKLSKSIKQIRAAHRLILTGTPIQNNVNELWCLFDFLMPGYLGSEKQFYLKYGRFISPQTTGVQRHIERALSSSGSKSKHDNASNEKENKDKEMNQLGVVALEALHKQVLPFLLRRTKEEVLKDLPPKIIQDYYCEMSQLQIELYQDFANSDANQAFRESLGLADQNDESAHHPPAAHNTNNSQHVFQALQYLRKVVNHPILVMKNDHPKFSFVQSYLKSHHSHINDYKHSGKLVALRELLFECGIGAASNSIDESDNLNIDYDNIVLNQHRVLIFCQLKSMIDIIENELLKKMDNVSYLRLDGTIPPSERFPIVKRFNQDPSIDILLLTTQIGGLGLNLTGADTVIFVEHDWNPQKDLQAMDRAHRIGQTKVVNVYRLITKGTIEEKIMSLQKFKLGVANSVVNMENSSLTSMGTEQLISMFNKEEKNGSKEGKVAKGGSDKSNTLPGSSYQKIIDSISEIWDENEYESEFSMDSFIKSLKK